MEFDNVVIERSSYANRRNGQAVKCPKHDDRKPSATIYEHGVYCHKCVKLFPFENHKYKKLYSDNRLKAETYHNKLKNSDDDSSIKRYLKDRNILSNYLSEEFHLGFDERKNALVFPIKNSFGDINGFGFRSISPEATVKYRNSKGKDEEGLLLFDKGNNLFGINKITDKCNHLVICEGYMCVISAFKNGFKDDTCFIALMGKTLGEKHLPILNSIKEAKSIKKISLMLDNDEAGKDATIKAVETLLTGNIFPSIIENFDQDNPYTTCKDIDEILQKKGGKNYLKEMLEKNSHDFLDYLLKQQTSDDDLKTLILKQIRDSDKRAEYAAKLCIERNLYKNLQFVEIHNYQEVTSLTQENAREYFFDENHWERPKLRVLLAIFCFVI